MQPDTFYHIYSHANDSENLFRTSDNYQFFLKKYAHHISPIADTYVYCLMPNHFHFLVKIRTYEELESIWKTKYSVSPTKLFEGLQTLEELVIREFSHLLNGYTQAYNKTFNRRGSLFMHPFRRKPIENDAYFTAIIHYIHANPVKHGFVKSIDDWAYSSYLSLISNKETRLKREEVLAWFYGREDFIKYHQQPIVADIDMEF